MSFQFRSQIQSKTGDQCWKKKCLNQKVELNHDLEIERHIKSLIWRILTPLGETRLPVPRLQPWKDEYQRSWKVIFNLSHSCVKQHFPECLSFFLLFNSKQRITVLIHLMAIMLNTGREASMQASG